MSEEYKIYGLLEEEGRQELVKDLFCEGISVQMLIDRTVGNSRKGSRRWVSKRISTDEASFIKNIETLSEQMNYLIAKNPKTDIRLYCSMNYRDLKKAERRFIHTIIDLQDEHKSAFYSRLNDSFISCLMKPSSKVKRYWLLDVDTNDETSFLNILTYLTNRCVKISLTYQTPNGHHIIVEPFNLTQHWYGINQDLNVTLQKDGLCLLRAAGKEKDV